MEALTNHPLSRVVGLDDLAREVKRLVRHGLPATDRTAGVVLPNLRNVVARAIHPDDPISRIDSLSTLMTRLVNKMNHERYGQPARILFGVAPGMTGTNLTQRRRHAADHLGYDLDHFRKRVEPEVVRAVADLLYRDMLRYKLRVTGGDKFASYNVWQLRTDDITAEEELSCLVWKFFYAVRSELIGARRHEGEIGFEARVTEHYDMAAKYSQGLRNATNNYRHLFGPIIRHGQVEFRIESLVFPALRGNSESAGPQNPTLEPDTNGAEISQSHLRSK